jgi:hypothetical protein
VREGGDVSGKLTSALLPGFELDLAAVFRPDSRAGV